LSQEELQNSPPDERRSSIARVPSLADQIYEDILRDIAIERLGDGQRLPSEVVLCERFGVSRPVLREALTRLKGDGFLVARQGSGNFIRRPVTITFQAGASMNAADILRGLEFRMGIESEAAYLAAKRRSDADIEEIASTSIDFVRVSNANEIGINSDFRFHLAIATASRNDLFVSSLWQTHRTIGHEMTLLNQASPKSAKRKQQAQDDHAAIFQAIVDGRADDAARHMRDHIGTTVQRILKMTLGS
jgi:GntR family transcriptional repressor for pyruvate dehydrogenase complex